MPGSEQSVLPDHSRPCSDLDSTWVHDIMRREPGQNYVKSAGSNSSSSSQKEREKERETEMEREREREHVHVKWGENTDASKWTGHFVECNQTLEHSEIRSSHNFWLPCFMLMWLSSVVGFC